MVQWSSIWPGLPIHDPGDEVAQQWVAQDLRSVTFHSHNNGEPLRQGKMVLLLNWRVFKWVCSNRCTYACMCICTCVCVCVCVCAHTHTHTAK
jgi:hypothetical protein